MRSDSFVVEEDRIILTSSDFERVGCDDPSACRGLVHCSKGIILRHGGGSFILLIVALLMTFGFEIVDVLGGSMPQSSKRRIIYSL